MERRGEKVLKFKTWGQTGLEICSAAPDTDLNLHPLPHTRITAEYTQITGL